jgi:4'-phosphopantetheinyl transferase
LTATPTWRAAGEEEVPADDAWLTEQEAARLASMRYAKRRLESRLGRWTAKTAVAHALGRSLDAFELRDVSIVNASDGAPEAFVAGAPAGLAVSMTDRAGWAVCMVAAAGTAIGCDLELVESRSPAFVADYFTPAERALVAGAGEAAHDLLANVIWSAKESALKVLRTGLRRDTRTVEVELEGDGGNWCALRVTVRHGDVFGGWWRRFDRFVLTCAAADGIAAPVSQLAGSPLDSAAPLHSWMARPLLD